VTPISQRRSLAELFSDFFSSALFWGTWAAALALILLVFLSPSLDNRDEHPRGWQRGVAVFARDAAMRRTAIASAIGLAVTACVFFRSPRVPRPPDPSRASGPVIGA
jgi:hypothetical protein